MMIVLGIRRHYRIINTINTHVVKMVNWYLVWSFIMLAVFLPAGIIMIVLYLYSDAKKEIFNAKEKKAYDSSKLEDWV